MRSSRISPRSLRGAVHDADAALLILAGGAATRCPGKLERSIGDVPMHVRTYCNLRGFSPTYIAVGRDLGEKIKGQIDAKLIFDRKPFSGPLCAIVDAFSLMEENRVFVVAADLPFATRSTLREIAAAWHSGDEGIVALDETDAPQPLLAQYDRRAFLDAAGQLHRATDGVKDVLTELRWRGVRLQASSATLNVNTEAEYAAASALAAAALSLACPELVEGSKGL